MSAKLTPWFDGIVKPVHVGVYMLMSGSRIETGYQYWNGQFWGSWCPNIEGAKIRRNEKASAIFQDDKWRGLAVKP